VLKVEEHVPFARFGEDRLLSTSGVGFLPADIKPFRHLPWIVGPPDQSRALLTAFNQMQLSARELGLTLEKLQVSERNSWSVQLADGLIIELGREAPANTFRRFIATLPLLGQKQIQSMVRVDLRYRNGYAVEWKPGAEPEWGSFVNQKDPRRSGPPQSI
jgi:cell division protein FtsQ